MAAFDSALVRKLTRYLPLGRAELAAARPSSRRSAAPIAAGTELVHERQVGHHAFILEEGWACSYKLLPDGGRQVIDFPIPGDVIGLRSVLLRASDHSFAAVTDVIVAEVSARQLVAALRAAAPAGRGVLVGRLARRGDGGRASGQHRPAQRPGPHRALPGRARAAPAARRPGLRDRLRLPLEPVPAGRCGRAHRDPRQPHPAPAARAQAAHLPRRPGDVSTTSRACASSPATTAATSTRPTARADAGRGSTADHLA